MLNVSIWKYDKDIGNYGKWVECRAVENLEDLLLYESIFDHAQLRLKDNYNHEVRISLSNLDFLYDSAGNKYIRTQEE